MLIINICRGVRFSFQFKFTLVTFLSFPGSRMENRPHCLAAMDMEDRSEVGKRSISYFQAPENMIDRVQMVGSAMKPDEPLASVTSGSSVWDEILYFERAMRAGRYGYVVGGGSVGGGFVGGGSVGGGFVGGGSVGGMGVFVGGCGVFVACGGDVGVREGLGVHVGRRVEVGLVLVGNGVMEGGSVFDGATVTVGTGVKVRVGVRNGVTVRVAKRVGVLVGVFVGVLNGVRVVAEDPFCTVPLTIGV
jgi:hypothetical protein